MDQMADFSKMAENSLFYDCWMKENNRINTLQMGGGLLCKIHYIKTYK